MGLLDGVVDERAAGEALTTAGNILLSRIIDEMWKPLLEGKRVVLTISLEDKAAKDG